MTTTAILAAIATVLMYFEFPVPLMPGFIKLDFSDLPALIAAFALGPLSGVVVCLLKNSIHLFATTSGGVGELCNFLLSATFVFIAGLVYKKMNNLKGAVIGSFIGAFAMAIFSVFVNYYIVYPIYTNFMPMEAIIGMYKVINPNVNNIWDALIWFNMPFTFIKGLINVVLAFLIYKQLSPLIKGAKT